MILNEITLADYQKLLPKNACAFESAEFLKLNAHKVDALKLFVLKDSTKNRFVLAMGVKNGVLKLPFSATFGMMNELSGKTSIAFFHQAIAALLEWAKANAIAQIVVQTPPAIYHPLAIAKLQNALFCAGFALKHLDINYELPLFKNIAYDSFLKSKARNYFKTEHRGALRALENAHREALQIVEKAEGKKVYAIIAQNRKERGFPLRLAENEVLQTAQIVASDFFVVNDKNGAAIAAAWVQRLTAKVANVVYWGHLDCARHLSPINFLAEYLYNFYAARDFDFLSIGTATEDSTPNVGLCDFKENIGCSASAKLTFAIAINSGGGVDRFILLPFSLLLLGAADDTNPPLYRRRCCLVEYLYSKRQKRHLYVATRFYGLSPRPLLRPLADFL